MKSKLAILGAMAMMGSMESYADVDRGIALSAPPVPIYSAPRRYYQTRTYGAGNSQRKRRKYARQTPSARKWK